MNSLAVRTRSAAASLTLLGALLSSGCQQAELEQARSSLNTVDARLEEMSAQMAQSQAALESIQMGGESRQAEIDAQLTSLHEQLNALPDSLELSCPQPTQADAQCEEVVRVMVSDDKMLVGELEYAYMDPPGVSVIARIDTGATSSSLHTENLVPFERDGEDWVRFDMMVSETESVPVERKIIRHVRVVQQADPEGSRRPVVAMRVQLGEIQDTFEFTLADRSHLENELILGRNFLADVTLVEVGKQFIQPRYAPPDAQ